MMNRKRVFWATSALFTSMIVAGAANAQSAGTAAFEESTVSEVVVTGARGPANVNGLAVNETVTRARATINQEYLATQQPGQTVLQSINILPGVTFNNSDAYGSSGGDIVIRGFDANRISLTLDGIPVNDTGNYAIYSNQQMDPELVERVAVNQGTTDVDSPTASATGGTISIQTRRPGADRMFVVQPSIGTDNFRRLFLMAETGEFGPLNTRAWVSYSNTDYDDAFGGPGRLHKEQYNARIWQPLGANGDYASLSFHFNRNRNHFYNNSVNVAAFNNGTWTGLTARTDECRLLPGGPGRQNQGDNALNPGCGSYYYHSINPSNTGNIRGQLRYTLADNVRLTIDPTFSYTLANGGGTTNISETDQRLQGSFFNPAAPTARGVDLNGDGDILDTIKLYSPSNTNTRRWGVATSLIWDVSPTDRIRFSYTWDHGNHRQTGEYGYLGLDGNPESPFSGKDGHGRQIYTLDGNVFQKRDRQSFALLNQLSVEYSGGFFDNAVRLNIGLRAPFFKRELNNNCWQSDTFNAWCTAQRPVAPLYTGSAVPGAPRSFEREYDALLPNVGASWEFAPNHSVYASYAENLSAPRTDDLYDRIPANPDPEHTQNFDLGYRYMGSNLIASGSFFYNTFDNYIIRAYEELPGGEVIAYSVNAGDISRWGVDGSIGWRFNEAFSIFASASYINSEIKSDLPGETAGSIFRTKGNELPEVPEFQTALRGEYTFGPIVIGAQAKYVGERWTNLTNTEKTDAYTVVDLDARWNLDFLREGTYLQVNAQNIFDEEYLANISTATSGNRSANLGAPRSVSATLRVQF